MLWTPTEFQKRLIEHGFDLPKFGADGQWGGESEAACQAWFGVGSDLALPPSEAPPVEIGIVPPAWMPSCEMERIIVHWTAGSYTVSATDKEHYHIIVDGGGNLVRGDKPITANVSTADNDGYAAHTKSCNSGSIGISAACMAGAVESPFNPGAYPLRQVQWEKLAAVAADLCRSYGIEVTPQTVLQHGEVEDNLGISQDGKWDINILPWDLSEDAGDAFRAEVVKRL
jgi:hypothetical protein